MKRVTDEDLSVWGDTLSQLFKHAFHPDRLHWSRTPVGMERIGAVASMDEHAKTEFLSFC